MCALDCADKAGAVRDAQFIFPGVGLGATVIGASRITDRMFYRAAKALAKCVSEEELAQGKVFPPVSDIRNVSLEVAVAGTFGQAVRCACHATKGLTVAARSCKERTPCRLDDTGATS